MGYYWEICDEKIKPKTEHKHFKSNIQKEFDKCNHIFLSFKKN